MIRTMENILSREWRLKEKEQGYDLQQYCVSVISFFCYLMLFLILVILLSLD
jgi:hypothetical protein